MSSKLALGTVQFGLVYGIANKTGKASIETVRNLLLKAGCFGVDTLDTAISYGDSEQILGEVGVDKFRIVTKLPPVPQNCKNVKEWVHQQVEESLFKLKIDQHYSLLLHQPLQLLEFPKDELYRALLQLKEIGLVHKIGVSIYAPDELEELVHNFDLDLIQAPFNILDRRLATSGWLEKLKKLDIEVHVRSVFLQGLLLMGERERPAYFERWQAIWKNWHRWLKQNNLSALQACLNFVASCKEIDRVIVGVDSLEQFEDILYNFNKPFVRLPDALISEDTDLINPSRWNCL